jgi:DNA polymerase-3 subunit epsilon
MREIALDTETTGLDPTSGHRIVEIGCVEVVNGVPTGRTFQRYVNPQRDMPEGAFAVHGLSEEFLARHPLFAEVAPDFLEFIGDATLIIHNAEFDLGFLNAELERFGLETLGGERAVDTVKLARRKFPRAQASLDALCKRFRIDISGRALHGALKDAELLSRVYLELIGGRQPGLELAAGAAGAAAEGAVGGGVRPPRAHAPTPEEEEAHNRFIDGLGDAAWRL